MSGGLRHVDDDGPVRCSFCPANAAGPCARCRRPVCGDCCTLTEGGVNVWAICLGCDQERGLSIGSAWSGFGLWLLGILAALAAVVALLGWLSK